MMTTTSILTHEGCSAILIQYFINFAWWLITCMTHAYHKGFYLKINLSMMIVKILTSESWWQILPLSDIFIFYDENSSDTSRTSVAMITNLFWLSYNKI
ncbi:unnamed protein product [Blepharisma stoltei]|uniref:Uncharacterized protein n=1 Tax=Blepharisma stoltei TaxID=1481888 RepID=A0AAU9J218_9CILI|nr:unnamed protein product [Blepharisma stoltei]